MSILGTDNPFQTVTVSLSRTQYEALNEAVQNERTLWKIVGEMKRLSRR